MSPSQHCREQPASLSTPSPLGLDILKTTRSMRKSLEGLHSCLFCPLCNNIFTDPVTLPACAHSFCQTCINHYSCNNYECPVPSCRLPLTLRGARIGKFDKTNPQIETVVSSFRVICSTLNASPNQWWKETKPTEASQEEKLLEMGEGNETYTFAMPSDDNDLIEKNNNIAAEDGWVEDTVMEMVDDGGEVEEEIMLFKGNEEDNLSIDGDDDPTDPFPVDDSGGGDLDGQGSLASRRSCLLPPTSPNCSFIAPESSQLTTPLNNIINDPKCMSATMSVILDRTVFYEKKEKEKIQVFHATNIPSKFVTVLMQLEEKGVIEIVEGIVDDTRVVAVCGNAEMETGEGWLVGLTFGYLWAMALGVPILYVSYFDTDLAFPYPKPDVKHRVIGVGSSLDWMGPQRAIETKKEGGLLFEDYTLILVGDFDKLPKLSSSRRKGRDSSTTFSKERISTLLKLCGANVIESIIEMEEDNAILDNNNKAAFLIRSKPRSRDWRTSRKAVDTTLNKKLPIVCANWLLESLADYRCKDLKNYTQQSHHM